MENALNLKQNKNLITVNIHPEHKFMYADMCTLKPISPNFFFVQDQEWINKRIRDAFASYSILYKGKILKLKIRKPTTSSDAKLKDSQKYLQFLFVIDEVRANSSKASHVDSLYLNDDYVNLTILKAKHQDAYETKPGVYQFMDFKYLELEDKKEDDFDINKEGTKEEMGTTMTQNLKTAENFVQKPLHNQDLISDVGPQTASIAPEAPLNTEDQDFINTLTLQSHLETLNQIES